MTRRHTMACVLASGWLVLGFGCKQEEAPGPGTACDGIEDCGGVGGLSCKGKVCVRVECDRTNECPVRAACVAGACSAPECTESEDCGQDGAVCFEGDCRTDLCLGVEACKADQACFGSPPTCRPPADQCAQDEACLRTQRCKVAEATCVDACEQEGDCTGRRWCDTDASFCRDLCVSGEDCGFGESCIQGQCTGPKECQGMAACPFETPVRNPWTCACQQCLESLDCALERQEACVEGRCVVCAVAAAEEEVCTGQGLRSFGACCVQCIEAEDCPDQGESCERGVCVAPGVQSCTHSAQCPTGEVCDGDRCGPEVSLAPCQSQSECPQGESCHTGGQCKAESSACLTGCPAPSRCVAEPGNGAGNCLGCLVPCAAEGCPMGQRCIVPAGAGEGFCAEAMSWQAVCEF